MKREYDVQKFMSDFVKCGIAGWCLEIVATSLESIAAKDGRLMGRTSLWMFPIYGMGALLGPISAQIDRRHGERGTLLRHGLRDMVMIFCAEYITGSMLKARNLCPWDYSGRRFHVRGLIRLDFAPVWFVVGLLFETITADGEKYSL